jgi:hypothetical protein
MLRHSDEEFAVPSSLVRVAYRSYWRACSKHLQWWVGDMRLLQNAPNEWTETAALHAAWPIVAARSSCFVATSLTSDLGNDAAFKRER